MAKEVTDVDIRRYLEADAIGRNSQLGILMNFINSVNEPIVIGIDDAWGTGKTVFVRQLQLMASQDVALGGIPGINKSIQEQFQDGCTVYYFNAWEYDYMPDPLYALGLSITSSFSVVEKTKRLVGKLPKMISFGGAVKKYSGEVVDPNKSQDVIDSALSVKAIRNNVESFIEELKKRSLGRKLIFIVDEIDRCKPSFAIDLLEVIKHYFQTDGIVFVVATNNSALSSTIKHYYGQDYNGGAYLERFFDFTIFLKRPDTKSYMKLIDGNHPWQYVDADIIDCFGLSMREIRHLYMLERMTDGFVNFSGCDPRDEKTEFAKYIALPIILAMIVVGDKNLGAVMAGRGADAICSVVEQSPACKFRISDMLTAKNNLNIMRNKVKELYDALFGDDEIASHFQEAIGILSSFTDIDKITVGDNNK